MQGRVWHRLGGMTCSSARSLGASSPAEMGRNDSTKAVRSLCEQGGDADAPHLAYAHLRVGRMTLVESPSEYPVSVDSSTDRIVDLRVYMALRSPISDNALEVRCDPFNKRPR